MRNGLAHPREIDYRGFFIIGVCLLGTGAVFMAVINSAFISFLGAGIAFMAIGLANRDQWITFKIDKGSSQ